MNDLRLYEHISEIKNDCPIKVRSYKGKTLAPHWHEHIELLYIFDGCGTFSCGPNSVTAKKNETIVVNSNELHSFSSDMDMDYLCIIINPVFFEDDSNRSTLLKSKIPEDSIISELVGAISKEYSYPGAYSDMIIKGKIYLLMAHLFEHYTAVRLSPYDYDIHIGRMEKINSMLEHIHKNYASPITTADLAKMCYLSESHVCKIFKEYAGVSVLYYLNRFRIDKAAVLLKNTDESISQIARSIGFDNLNYFDRIFKRYKEASPGEYRAKKDI